MLRYVVCDDDPSHLQSMLRALTPSAPLGGREVALVTADAQSVLDYAKTAQPYTLYFLDLKLDDSEQPLGLALCRQILALDASAYVVFVSAYPQYALSCCQSHAFDFLVKPFTNEQLADCVRAVELDLAARSAGIPLTAAMGSRVIRLDQCRILYFGRRDDYVYCHSLEGDFYWRESFSTLLGRLEKGMFLRSHNGYIVNLRHVAEADTAENQLRMSDQSAVPYSRRSEKAVLAALNKKAAVL